jgi:hypothetical protein
LKRDKKTASRIFEKVAPPRNSFYHKTHPLTIKKVVSRAEEVKIFGE